VKDSAGTTELTTEETVNTANSDEDNEAAAIKSTSSSDELDSIDADLQATNLEGLDAEVNPQLN